MPNYEIHLSAGTATGLLAGAAYIVTLGPYLQPGDDIALTLFIIVAHIWGSVFPDVDLHNSKPRKLFNFFLVTGLGGGAFLYSLRHWLASSASFDARIGVSILVGGFVLLLGSLIVPPLVQAVTPSHRGVFHNPVFWGGVLFLPALAVWKGAVSVPMISYPIAIAIVAPSLIAVFTGTLVHILLDVLEFFTRYVGYRPGRRSEF